MVDTAADAPATTGTNEPDPQPGLVPAISPAGTTLMQRAGAMAAAFTGLVPTSIGEAVILAGHLAKSKAVPKALRDPDTMLTVILAGIEIGLAPIRAAQSITNISGTLCMKADLQLALVKARPGVLAFYDEGFERFERTDGNLERRIQLALAKVLRKLGATDQDVADDVALVVEKIAAATSEGMKAGDPYGWAVGMRLGDPTVHVRTFTFADAEKAIIYEHDEGNPNGPKEKKPLSQKFNYKSFPGDMYPKRARTRLLQVLASDVTNGLPAAEAIEGGQVIEAEYTVDVSNPDDVDTLLAAIRDQDSEAATTVENGFKQLNMGKAAQLQKLTQFRGKPAQLIDWLKDEYAHRRGVDRRRPDVLGDTTIQQNPPAVKTDPPVQQPAATTTAAQPAAGGGAAQGEVIDAEVDDDHEPGQLTDANATVIGAAAVAAAETAAANAKAAAEPMTATRDLAARFRKGAGGKLKSF